MSDPVPAITEAAATGETAAIFADIRNVLGVDVVNLIWRHLATIDGALPWAWGTLRPLYADGSVGNEAQALRAALMLPPASPIPAEVFAGLGLRPHDLTDIRGVRVPMTTPTRWRWWLCRHCRRSWTGIYLGASCRPNRRP